MEKIKIGQFFQMQLMSKQFNIVSKKENKIFSTCSIKYRVQKKARSSKKFFLVKWQTTRIFKKKFFLFFQISQNMIERCTKKKMKNKKYRNIKIFSSDNI